MNSEPFRLFLWPHRLLFIGPAFGTETHCHHAAQLAVGLHDTLRVRGGEAEPWRQAAAFYVPPDQMHGFDAGDSPCALLYLDPEGIECEHACHRFGDSGIRTVDSEHLPVAALGALAAGQGDTEAARRACVALLGRELLPARRDVDPRLRRALDWLDDHLEDAVRLTAVAAMAGVSESWLSHRFMEDIGVPLRRYVLWRRLRLAVDAALGGATLTEAAHAAGFADSAHLTRTFRANFGVPPSFLFGARDRLMVEFLD